MGASSGDAGVQLQAGGGVANGPIRRSRATIEGYTGVLVSGGSGAVTNYGTVSGLGTSEYQCGVYLKAGGAVINGAGSDRTALLEATSVSSSVAESG